MPPAPPKRSSRTSPAPTTKDQLAEFLELSQVRRPRCTFGIALDKLSPEDRALVQMALDADPEVYLSTGIEKWLAARGVKVNNHTLRRHRRGACSCGDE